MDQLSSQVTIRILLTAGTPYIWRVSMGMAEQTIAQLLWMEGDSTWIYQVVWDIRGRQASRVSDDRNKFITCYSGIAFLIKYSMRVHTWNSLRTDDKRANLIGQNIRHRRMMVTNNGKYWSWLKSLATIQAFDGSSSSIPIRLTVNNPFPP